MTCYLFILAMAIFNACMDAFENENFFESIFKRWHQRFWYKRESWKWAKKFFGYKVDAWHLSKSLMILCFAGAVIAAKLDPPRHGWPVILLNIGLLWNLTFYLVYHKVFGIK